MNETEQLFYENDTPRVTFNNERTVRIEFDAFKTECNDEDIAKRALMIGIRLERARNTLLEEQK